MTIEVVRSEEELVAVLHRRAVERVVVRTRVVTEDVVLTVPVRKQVVEIERVPIEPGDGAGVDVSGEPDVIEVVLHEERPVVTYEVVPVERVRVVREVSRSGEQVSAVRQREEVTVTAFPAYPDAPPGQELFPIVDYDELRVDEILPLLDQLEDDELEEVERRERGGKARAGVLRRLSTLLAARGTGA